MKVFVVCSRNEFAQWIDYDYEIVDEIEKADVVIFTGGKDIKPLYYKGLNQTNYEHDLQRDKYEFYMYSLVKPNQLCIGICRGAQLICVANGGKLLQHCENHRKTQHLIKNVNDNNFSKYILANSFHHQALDLKNVKHKLLYESLDDIPEIAFIGENNLCFQFHPERMVNNIVENNKINKIFMFYYQQVTKKF